MISMLFKTFWFLVLSIFSTFAGCYPVPESDIYETEGVASMSVENAVPDDKWERVNHYSSTPLLLGSSEASGIIFQIYIQSPGNYSLWMLSAMKKRFPENEPVFIAISDSKGFLQYQGRILLNKTEYLTWSQIDHESTPIEFEQAGFYQLELQFRDHSGFLFEKLHLTKDNVKPPAGFGLPETTAPDLDPVLMKRQQPVMLPPAWAFGLMVWAEDDEEAVIDSLLSEEIWVDAVLHRSDGIQTQIQRPSRLNGQEQVFTANIVDISGEEFIPDDIEFSEKRHFMLSGMQNIDNPDFKRLPAKWVNFLPEPSSGISASEVLKQRIEMVSDPARATTEAPFISSGTDDRVTNVLNGDMSDEILIRWVQFSALTGMMHLNIPPNNSSKKFSAGVIQEIRKVTQLRSRLFPYLYSLAHLVRARAENPVRGDGDHKTQFQLGEAFLVAPVFREGDDSRSVWFPEGAWYDYWSGERFEGGQTWLVDVSANEIPLFVKAGSIIPYRSLAGQIMERSNRELTIEIYTGGVGTFRLYEDDGMTNRYRNGEVATTGFRYFETDEYATFTIGRTAGEYEDLPEKRSLSLKFLNINEKPDQVIANSNNLEIGDQDGEWTYDERGQVLTIEWNQLTELKTDFEIRF